MKKTIQHFLSISISIKPQAVGLLSNNGPLARPKAGRRSSV